MLGARCLPRHESVRRVARMPERLGEVSVLCQVRFAHFLPLGRYGETYARLCGALGELLRKGCGKVVLVWAQELRMVSLMSWNKSNAGTKHSPSCSRVFGRYDAACVRCQELANGGKARAGWNDQKNRQEAQRSAAITRFFAPGGEYSRMTDIQKHTCTAFEW